MLIGIDEEGGDVTRLEAATGSSYPGNLALGAVDDVELTEQVAASIGGRAGGGRVNLDLAPVADVNTNPLNPVIGIRAFGSDPASSRGTWRRSSRVCRRAGVAACAKHFPGHGATESDSHLELPTVAAGLDELRGRSSCRSAPRSRPACKAIMTAHILVPAVAAVPATISRAPCTTCCASSSATTGS